MEIIRTRELEIEFSDIDRGECFSPVGSDLIYMKTILGMNYMQDEDINAVELTDGTFEYFEDNRLVNKVKCQLIVK